MALMVVALPTTTFTTNEDDVIPDGTAEKSRVLPAVDTNLWRPITKKGAVPKAAPNGMVEVVVFIAEFETRVATAKSYRFLHEERMGVEAQGTGIDPVLPITMKHRNKKYRKGIIINLNT